MSLPKDPRRMFAYRMAVAARIVLAVVGGYSVGALLTALLSLILPMVLSEAVATGTLLSFAAMVLVVVFVFAAPTLARAALAVAGLALSLGAGLWLVGGFSGATAA